MYHFSIPLDFTMYLMGITNHFGKNKDGNALVGHHYSWNSFCPMGYICTHCLCVLE